MADLCERQASRTLPAFWGFGPFCTHTHTHAHTRAFPCGGHPPTPPTSASGISCGCIAPALRLARRAHSPALPPLRPRQFRSCWPQQRSTAAPPGTGGGKTRRCEGLADRRAGHRASQQAGWGPGASIRAPRRLWSANGGSKAHAGWDPALWGQGTATTPLGVLGALPELDSAPPLQGPGIPSPAREPQGHVEGIMA